MRNDGSPENWRDVTLELENSPRKVKNSRSLIRNKATRKPCRRLEKSPKKKSSIIKVRSVYLQSARFNHQPRNRNFIAKLTSIEYSSI